MEAPLLQSAGPDVRHKFIERNIDSALRTLNQKRLSESEKAEIRQELRRAESASESGNIYYARRLTGDIVKELQKIPGPGVMTGPFPEIKHSNPADEETETRTYQDKSADPFVSHKVPTGLNIYQAPLAVKAHESQHVRRERFKAAQNGEVIHTYVRLKYSVDMSGKRYLAGGQTKVYRRKSVDYAALAHLSKPKFSVRV